MTEQIDIRLAAMQVETEWRTRPFIVLACGGYADEHWQIYHPADLATPGAAPRYLLAGGVLEPVNDS